jgi:hypothetical protein
MEKMEAQVLVSKLGKARGSLKVDAIGNQAQEGGNESDCVITSSKFHKASQTHPCARKRKTRNIVQPHVELEPRSCT